MPERPDLDLYVDHLERRLRGEVLEGVRIASPFVLRTAVPAAGARLHDAHVRERGCCDVHLLPCPA